MMSMNCRNTSVCLGSFRRMISTAGGRDRIRQILGIISTYEHQHGRPMLTAIVVHKQDNIPGHGFFELAQHLGLLKPGADELAFFCGEVARVHSAWKDKR